METEQKRAKAKISAFFEALIERNWKLYAVECNGMEYCWRWMEIGLIIGFEL